MNWLADQWWTAAARASFEGGLALAIVWIICRGFRRIPAWAQCWLWRLACLKLLFSFCSSVTIKAPLLPPPPLAPDHAIILTLSSPPAEIETSRLPAPSNPPPKAKANPNPLLLSIWIGGVLIGFGKLFSQFFAAVRLRKTILTVQDNAIPAQLSALAEQVSHQLALKIPLIRVSEKISRPLLLGIANPVILFPARLTDWNDEQLRLMLAHEMAHLKRRDLPWNWLGAAAQILFWFHPLIWLSAREWRLVQEMACDELALRQQPSRASELANILIDLAAGNDEDAAPKILTAGIIETKSTLERRLKAMKFIQSGRTARVAAITAIAAAALAILPWRIVAQKPPEHAPLKTASAVAETPSAIEPSKDTSPAEARKLVAQEIDLVRKQAETLDRQMKNGVVSNEEVLEHSRELERLQREAALLDGDGNAYRKSLEREITLVQELQKAEEKRQAVGVSSPEARIKIERQLLQLQRQAAMLNGTTNGNKGKVYVSDGMAYYMSNPELMKRYFPQMYNMMLSKGLTNVVAANFDPAQPKEHNGNPVWLTPARSGRVESVPFKKGDHFKKGQILLRLDERPVDIQIKTAEAKLQIAEADYKLKLLAADAAGAELKDLDQQRPNVTRTRELQFARDKAGIELQRGKAELEIVRQELEKARLELDSYSITAPRNGEIYAAPRVGDRLSEGMPAIHYFPDEN